jgi:hypothetical protein
LNHDHGRDAGIDSGTGILPGAAMPRLSSYQSGEKNAEFAPQNT